LYLELLNIICQNIHAAIVAFFLPPIFYAALIFFAIYNIAFYYILFILRF